MTYEEMKQNESLTKLIEDLLKKSKRKFTSSQSDYEMLQPPERKSYIASSLCKILRWIDVIFKRPERSGNEPWDKDALKNDRTYPILDEYGDSETMKIRETAIDDLYKIVRMHIYVTDNFFKYRNPAVKNDCKAVIGLFKKICTAKKADFYTNHNCIEELYNLIDEEQDLEQYFEYNGIEFLSAKLPNLDIKNIKYQYIEFDKDYKRLKRYFEFIVHTYMSALTHKADYTKELTDPERNFIEFVFDFSYNYKGSIDKLKNDHWEIIHIEERTLLLEYMDKMCELDINILNKYIGASTTQEFETRFEDLRMKLLNPVSYRIFNAIRDIQAELPMNKTIEDIVADDIDGYREETCRIKEIEQKLLSVKSNIIDINKREEDNSILSYIYNSLEL